MKRILTALFTAFVLASGATAVSAFEKDVDYVVAEEDVEAGEYKGFAAAYPYSTTEGWPECTTGTLLTGTIIGAVAAKTK